MIVRNVETIESFSWRNILNTLYAIDNKFTGSSIINAFMQFFFKDILRWNQFKSIEEDVSCNTEFPSVTQIADE